MKLRLARDAMLIASHRGGASSYSGSFIDGLERRVQALETSHADVDFQVFTAGAVEAKIDERIVGVRPVLSGSLEDLFDKRLASSLSSITNDRDLLVSSLAADAKVWSFADACCEMCDKFESHLATLAGSCANLDAQVKSFSESCRRSADAVANMSTCVSALDRTTGDFIQRTDKSHSELRRFCPVLIHWKNLLRCYRTGFSRFIRCSIVSCFRDASGGAGGVPSASATHAHHFWHWLVSSSFAIVWPRSGRSFWRHFGRGQGVVCGFCLAEVRAWSVGSAWPRSSRALWGLLGRGLLQLLGCPAQWCLRGAVILRVRGQVVVLAFVLSVCFFFCSPMQFSFFSCPLRK